jgi:hypothetical protein
MFEINPAVALLVSTLVVPVLAQIIKLIFAKMGKPIDRKVVTAVLFVLAVVAGAFSVDLPALAGLEPFMAVEVVLVWVSAVMGAAQALYNLALGPLFERLGLTTSAFLG